MEIIEFDSRKKELAPYIYGYYSTQSNENKDLIEFTYYPHYMVTLNLFCQSNVKIKDQVFSVYHKPSNNSFYLSADKNRVMEAKIHTKYDIIGIHFYPLAIHYFFEMKNFQMVDKGLFLLNAPKELEDICELNQLEDRHHALDQFFSDAFRNPKIEIMETMINRIHQRKGSLQITELQELVHLSRRTILRKFQKYVFCSFEAYKNILRFRLAIENFKDSNLKASELLSNSSYYDQSDFISHFKTFTGESPKKLLTKIKNNSNSVNFFWKL